MAAIPVRRPSPRVEGRRGLVTGGSCSSPAQLQSIPEELPPPRRVLEVPAPASHAVPPPGGPSGAVNVSGCSPRRATTVTWLRCARPARDQLGSRVYRHQETTTVRLLRRAGPGPGRARPGRLRCRRRSYDRHVSATGTGADERRRRGLPPGKPCCLFALISWLSPPSSQPPATAGWVETMSRRPV